ncbi:hypothetical protein HNP84_002664 [Thermocatellispora tengchongensis]|uniref:Serine protease n=1 Tax=Thermocatellispora tengchongensis TaxID=1073253 RepID=A0A840P4W1_9ACTN|nr:trypsin-like peptidase domain-containing protein [Thermocatellispora tengchongensis]MBB5132943.1 hypothetical protein [Thermocatellispora tengchongensis]
MRKTLRTTLAAAGVALAGVTAAQGTAVAAPQEAKPPRDVAVGTRIAAMTDPAVQLIYLQYTATARVPSVRPTKAFGALQAKARKHAKAKRIPADRQSQLKWVLRQAAADVDRYLAPAKPYRTTPVVLGGLCTGWWVTPQGHMVTGAHCTSADAATLRETFTTQAIPDIAERDVKTFLNAYMDVAQPDDDLVTLANTMFTRFGTAKMRVTGLKKEINLVRALPGGGMDRTSKFSPLTLLDEGEPWPGLDYALLKLKGARNLPTVPLGRDGDVRVGDQIYINGFPGLITQNVAVFDPKSRLYPTLTEGAVNAKRTTVRNVPYIQSQAPSYGGNSGGPVFSKDGKVIGILIAGSVDQATGETAENHSFILPVDVIRKRLAAAEVKPALSETSRLYNAALNDYFAGRYRAALPKFRQVRELYPAHPYVGTYIADTKKAIAAGKDK